MSSAPTSRTALRLLRALKLRGPCATSRLSRLLHITLPGVRQQLRRLQEQGLVVSGKSHKGVGRPEHLWSLTEAGHATFPRREGELLVQVLEVLRNQAGEAGMRAVVERCYRMTEVRYRRALADAQAPSQRMQRLCALLEADEYMPVLNRIDEPTWSLAKHHCPIYSAVKVAPVCCDCELGVLRRLLPEASVELKGTMRDGGQSCLFRIRFG